MYEMYDCDVCDNPYCEGTSCLDPYELAGEAPQPVTIRDRISNAFDALRDFFAGK